MFGKLKTKTLWIIATASTVCFLLAPLLAAPLSVAKDLIVSHVYWAYFAASDAELNAASLLVKISGYVLIAIVLLVATAAIISGFLSFRELRKRRCV